MCADWPDLCNVMKEIEVLTDIVSYSYQVHFFEYDKITQNSSKASLRSLQIAYINTSFFKFCFV